MTYMLDTILDQNKLLSISKTLSLIPFIILISITFQVFTQTSISPTGLSCPATYPPGPDQAIAAGNKTITITITITNDNNK